MKKNILVFPCGSEIGLEINNALKYSVHVELFGASSVNDHGKFVYKNYIGNLPFVDDKRFLQELSKVIKKYKIDFIYPAHDSIVLFLARNKKKLLCNIIGPEKVTAEICRSKLKTYQKFSSIFNCPKIYRTIQEIKNFPVFLKPDIGQGSRGTYIAKDAEEVKFYLKKNKSLLILQFLPGPEYTVDCFTTRKRNLSFFGPRLRNRIKGGISVNTFPIIDNEKFKKIANLINKELILRGAWFFQVKEDEKGELYLLEIAPRIAGSMALYRNMGINFELLSVYDACNIDMIIEPNDFFIELDRALTNKFKINIEYDSIYVDLDDCLIIKNKINTTLIKFLYQCINNNKSIYLITRHKDNVNYILKKFRINNLFDNIFHIDSSQPKSSIIKEKKAILIDDSFSERLEVRKQKRIPVFSLDSIECLLL